MNGQLKYFENNEGSILIESLRRYLEDSITNLHLENRVVSKKIEWDEV